MTRPIGRRTTAVGVALVVSACSGAGGSTSQAPPPTPPVAVVPATAAPSTTDAPVITTTTTAATTTERPYEGTIAPISGEIADRMAASWRPGCPVGLDELRYLQIRHWGLDGEVHDGELVVHADVAEALIAVFGRLYEARVPIERMRLVDDYGGDDARSMAANNTSAFNCREVAHRPGVWSHHAFGTAIDINPLVNPYVDGTFVDPPAAAPYADRTTQVPGGIYPGDIVTQAFADIGWGWGGDWAGARDYQHFSASGR